jgi:chorismate synthase
VDDLDLLSKDVQQSFESMSARSKQYFARWEKEAATIQNEDVRAQSAARKAEVSSALDNVKRLYAETQTTFRPFMSDLRDIQKYLGTDLTTGGVAAMRNTTTKATANAAKVKESVKSLATEFRKLGASMAPVAEATAR